MERIKNLKKNTKAILAIILNFTKKEKKLSSFIIQTSLLTFILYNFQIITKRLLLYIKTESLISVFNIIPEAISVYLIISLLYFLFSFNKYILKIFITFIFFISSIGTYYISAYNIVIDSAIIASVFTTSVELAKEIVGIRIFIWLFFTFLLPTVLIWKMKIKPFEFNLKECIKKIIYYFSAIFINLLILISVIFTFFVDNKIEILKGEKELKYIIPGEVIISSYTPINILNAVNLYIKYNSKINLKNKIILSEKYDVTYKGEKDLQVILIIGEAARGDHFGINGYKRETTPNLSKLKNIVNYDFVKSCHTSTFRSIPCMLSRLPIKNTIKNNVPTESSFIDLFNKTGFKTYWYGLQSIKPASYFIPEIQEVRTKYSIINQNKTNDYVYDELLLPILDKNLNKDQNDKKLIILHTLGSHMNYYQRYPKTFEKYTPVCFKDIHLCKKEAVINSYDNTILYTDWFISEVIKKFENKNAIIFYVSDHGQSLGENGIYTHGRPIETAPREQRYATMFVWFSDIFLTKNRKKMLTAKNKKNINHDYLFHSILNCSNIETKAVNKKLSICR